MSDKSNIAWTDATWTCITGCTRVSPGCTHCYAEQLTATRLAHMPKYKGLAVVNSEGEARWTNDIRLHRDELTTPLHWRKPKMIFVNSMSDTFHKDVPFEFIDKMFAIMALCPQHTFQILTKRPERMAEYLAGLDLEGPFIEAQDGAYRLGAAAGCLLDGAWIWGPGKTHRGRIEEFICDTHAEDDLDVEEEAVIYEAKPVRWPLPNVWLGASIENQKCADKRIPHLLKCPAAIRFLSIEPLLGPIDLDPYLPGMWACHKCGHWMVNRYAEADEGEASPCCSKCRSLNVEMQHLHQAILGNESRISRVGRFADGYPDAAHSIIDQCQAAGVAVFVKQWPVNGYVSHEPSEWPEWARVREYPKVSAMAEVR